MLNYNPSVASNSARNLIYPDNLKQGDENHFVLFTSYPQTVGTTNTQQGSYEYSIALPLPPSALKHNSEAVYATQEGLSTVLTEVGQKTSAGISEYFRTGDAGNISYVDMAKDGYEASMDAATGGVGDFTEAGLARLISKAGILQRAAAGAGVAVNPKLSLL